jgi:ribonuclease HI
MVGVSKIVVAATDGSAINNPHGPAGWAWFVSEDCWAAGGFTKASNQVAELFAVLALLRAVPREYEVLVRTDSQFTINVMTKWLPGWKRNGWKKADGGPVANLALIQDLDRASTGRTVRYEWVRGHSGDPMNEIADRICGAASDALRRGREDQVVRGPGWTGFKDAPVIPQLGRAKPRFVPMSTPMPKPATVVGERLTDDDIRARGYGANARVVRVSTAKPVSPERPKFDICGSCDGPIHPLTLHCRCGSM